MKRQHYTNEEKEKLLFRYASEPTDVKDLLQEVGIPKSTFNQWLREYDTKHNCRCENDFSPRNYQTPNEVEAAYIQSIMTEPGGSVC